MIADACREKDRSGAHSLMITSERAFLQFIFLTTVETSGFKNQNDPVFPDHLLFGESKCPISGPLCSWPGQNAAFCTGFLHSFVSNFLYYKKLVFWHGKCIIVHVR